MQETFNLLMENAIVYLQEKGYLPKQPTQQQPDESKEPTQEEITAILKGQGLL